MRTQDEIAARLRSIRASGGDVFGFRAEVLASYLDRDHVAEFVEPDLSRWCVTPLTEASAEAADYLVFAFGKARDHRGVSASRSVEKLTEWAWLAGRDDVVEAMREADYPKYGVPMLLAYAAGFDLPVPDDEALARMGRGQVCDPDGCDAGCGW